MNEKEHIAIIASNIKRLIKEKGINQKILAKALDISPSTITEYMQLRTRPSHGVIQKMADYFGVLKSDIDTTWKTENSTNINIEKTVKTMEQLEEPRQKVVLETASFQLNEQLEEEKKRAAKVVPLKKKRLTDEELWDVVEHGVANDGTEQTDHEKQFFFNLLREHLDNDDEYED